VSQARHSSPHCLLQSPNGVSYCIHCANTSNFWLLLLGTQCSWNQQTGARLGQFGSAPRHHEPWHSATKLVGLSKPTSAADSLRICPDRQGTNETPRIIAGPIEQVPACTRPLPIHGPGASPRGECIVHTVIIKCAASQTGAGCDWLRQ